MPLPGGEHREGLQEVGVLHRGEDRIGRPLELGLLPVVVQAEVLARLLVVAGISCEDSREQLEDVQRQAADVDLLEDGRDGGLVGALVEHDRRDVVGRGGLDELLVEALPQLTVVELQDPAHVVAVEQVKREVPVLTLLVMVAQV